MTGKGKQFESPNVPFFVSDITAQTISGESAFVSVSSSLARGNCHRQIQVTRLF